MDHSSFIFYNTFLLSSNVRQSVLISVAGSRLRVNN